MNWTLNLVYLEKKRSEETVKIEDAPFMIMKFFLAKNLKREGTQMVCYYGWLPLIKIKNNVAGFESICVNF